MYPFAYNFTKKYFEQIIWYVEYMYNKTLQVCTNTQYCWQNHAFDLTQIHQVLDAYNIGLGEIGPWDMFSTLRVLLIDKTPSQNNNVLN